MRLFCALFGIALLGLGGCADDIPEARNIVPAGEVVVEVLSEGTPFYSEVSWPASPRERLEFTATTEALSPGTRIVVLGRHDSWLRVDGGWIEGDRVRFILGSLEDVPLVLVRGLWLLSPDAEREPLLVTGDARWNSWQWDPEGGALWYPHFEALPADVTNAPVSRMTLGSEGVAREYFGLVGDVLASPRGGAVLVRVFNRDIWPLGDVYILDADGSVHQIGRQCDVYFTDAYIPFGLDAAWSPDGQYVVLRNSAEPNERGRCFVEGASIYDRNGLVERDPTDPDDPYRQDWYREPNFGDQVGTDEICDDAPDGVVLSDRRNRCQWSPDRRWFAAMPGAVDDPYLGELTIYSADGTPVNRWMLVFWPCNSFQWSPDSEWLAYGGPSQCA